MPANKRVEPFILYTVTKHGTFRIKYKGQSVSRGLTCVRQADRCSLSCVAARLDRNDSCTDLLLCKEAGCINSSGPTDGFCQIDYSAFLPASLTDSNEVDGKETD